MNLTANMRVELHNGMSPKEFTAELLEAGDDRQQQQSYTCTKVMCSKSQLTIESVFPNIKENFGGRKFNVITEE